MLFGNPAWTSAGPGYFAPGDLYGHFDPLFMANWGMPVIDCIVTSVNVYGPGPPLGEPNAIGRFGIYDASSGIPNNYVLVAVSPTWSWPATAPAQWWSVGCSIPLASGTYSLALISYSPGAIAGGFYFSLKAWAPTIRTFLTPGVFPNPLGAAVSLFQNLAMYAEYKYATDPCL